MSEETTLMNLSVAIRALARAKEPDEVGQIRDKAEAIRAYLKRQGMALDAQNDAAEVKLRAERRLAEILDEEIDRQGVGRPAADTNVPTMEGLNIGHSEASRWRVEAAVPEPDFCGWLAEMRAKNADITTAALLRFARGYVGSEERGSTAGTQFVGFSFQVPQDGAEVVRAAMVEAAKISGVSHPGINLVGICQDFLSGILPAAKPQPPDFNDV